jgi:23S rRNA-/tRNA-specific pseudouridylate synthase
MQLLEHLLQHHPQIKRTSFKRLLLSHRILVNGKPAQRLKAEVNPEDKVQILDQPFVRPRKPRAPKPAPPKPSRRDPALMPLRIFYEDDDLLVVLKPAGLLTSTNERETRPTLAAGITNYLANTSPDSRIGIIHRLDKDASGLLVFTKNPKAYHHLKRQLFARTVDRVYTAVIEGVPTPKDGRIENRLVELPTGKVIRTDDRSEGEMAVTEYQMLAKARVPKKTKPPKKGEPPPKNQPPGATLPLRENVAPDATHVSLLRIKLYTGRKHQIRAHFAARRTPIVGDRVYGPVPDPTLRLLLAATTLAFAHPRTGQRLTFAIEPPKEIQSLFPDVKFETSEPKPVTLPPRTPGEPPEAEADDDAPVDETSDAEDDLDLEQALTDILNEETADEDDAHDDQNPDAPPSTPGSER